MSMEFGLSKCKCVNLINGRYKKTGGIVLDSGGVMAEIDEDGDYKYLGIMELDKIRHDK